MLCQEDRSEVEVEWNRRYSRELRRTKQKESFAELGVGESGNPSVVMRSSSFGELEKMACRQYSSG